MAELKEAAAFRTQVAEILKQYRLENIRTKANAEEIAASQDFEVIQAILLSSNYKLNNNVSALLVQESFT